MRSSIIHLHRYFKAYGFSNKPLIGFSLFLFFWTLFDGLVGFFTPILITEKGFSVFVMGLIYSSSSIFGAIFDLIIGRYFPHTNYKRFIYALLLLCFAYPLLLFYSNNAFLFVCAMAIWGIYYDLKMFGKFDFIVRQVKEKEHTSAFGLLSIFEGLGYLLAPILGGFLIIVALTWYPVAFSYLFLVLSSLFFILTLLLAKKTRSQPFVVAKSVKKTSFFTEIKSWIKVSKKIRHLLILSLFISLLDSFYWTVGPLLVERFDNHFLGSLFLTSFILPALFTGLFIGKFSQKYSDKKIAFGSFLIGCILLFLIHLVRESELLMVIIVLFSSVFFSLCLPALSSLFVKFVELHPEHEVDIFGVNDFFVNIAYVLGPAFAGLLAELFGFTTIFSIYSVLGFIITIAIIVFGGKKFILAQY